MAINNMLIIGSLSELYKAQPQLISNMHFYILKIYTKSGRIHTDKVHDGGNSIGVVECLTNVEFFYHDTTYDVKTGNYILFDCLVLHGNLTKSKYTEYKIYLYNNPNVILTHKLLDNLL